MKTYEKCTASSQSYRSYFTDSAGFGWSREFIFFTVADIGLLGVCVENNVDHTGIFSLLLSSAYTTSRLFLLLTPLHQRVGWRCTRNWRGYKEGLLIPTDYRNIPNHMMS